MNLKDFDKTIFPGLFISKDEHPSYGKKYITRFQYGLKRYVKVLGYDKLDRLNDNKALKLMQEYKNVLAENKDIVLQDITNEKVAPKNKVSSKQKTPTRSSVKKMEEKVSIPKSQFEECKFLKNTIGDYKSVAPDVFAKGIQKIYDYEEMKEYQVELIKLQKYLEKTKKKMIILFEGRDASGKGGAIRRITRYMNSRHYRVVALGKPTETQKKSMVFSKIY